jgi:hypothetical protein
MPAAARAKQPARVGARISMPVSAVCSKNRTPTGARPERTRDRTAGLIFDCSFQAESGPATPRP